MCLKINTVCARFIFSLVRADNFACHAVCRCAFMTFRLLCLIEHYGGYSPFRNCSCENEQPLQFKFRCSFSLNPLSLTIRSRSGNNPPSLLYNLYRVYINWYIVDLMTLKQQILNFTLFDEKIYTAYLFTCPRVNNKRRKKPELNNIYYESNILVLIRGETQLINAVSRLNAFHLKFSWHQLYQQQIVSKQ